MLPHPWHSKELAGRILAVLVSEEQADEFDGNFGFDPVENSPRVIQRRGLRLPHRSALDEQSDSDRCRTNHSPECGRSSRARLFSTRSRRAVSLHYLKDVLLRLATHPHYLAHRSAHAQRLGADARREPLRLILSRLSSRTLMPSCRSSSNRYRPDGFAAWLTRASNSAPALLGRVPQPSQ